MTAAEATTENNSEAITNTSDDSTGTIEKESFKSSDFYNEAANSRREIKNGNMYQFDPLSKPERRGSGVFRAVDSPQDIIGSANEKIREDTRRASIEDPNAVENQIVSYSLYPKVSAINVSLRGDVSRILDNLGNRRANMPGFEQAIKNNFTDTRPLSEHTQLVAELDEFINLAAKLIQFRKSLPI